MNKSSKVKEVSPDDKLNALNQEISELYAKYKKDGLTKEKLKDKILPISQLAKRIKWKIRAKRILYFCMVIAAIAGATQWKVSNKAISVVYTKTMVYYVLPYYDWTWLWEEECIMSNPYFEPENVTDIDCNVCKNLTSIRVLENVNTTLVSETIFQSEPICIADAMHEWPAITQSLTLNDLTKLYNSNKNLKGYDTICELRVSKGYDLHDGTVQEMFAVVRDEISSDKDGNFTAHWTACHRNSSREMHKFYYKPYFLPGMCEPAREENHVLAGRKSSKKTKALTFRTDATSYWIGQVDGDMQMWFQPTYSCEKECKSIKFVLKKGQILNVPSSSIYSLAFRPASESALALAVAYTY